MDDVAAQSVKSIDWRRPALVVFTILVGLAPALKVIVEPREQVGEVYDFTPVLDQAEPPGWAMLHIGLNLVVFALAGYLLIEAAAAIRHSKPRKNWRLLGTFLVFIALQDLAYALSTAPQLKFETLLFPIAFLALAALEPGDLPLFVRIAREVLLFYVIGSLISAVLFPARSIEHPFPGIIPYRLYGIASHANALAPLAAAFFAFDLMAARLGGAIRPWRRIFDWLVALLVIVLCQSKTVEIAVVVAAFVGWLATGSAERATAGVLVIIVAAALLLISIEFLDLRFSTDNATVEEATTLTGRTDIWSFVMDLWRQNPLFGYGPMLLRDQTRLDFFDQYNWLPGQAHNQWVEMLGTAGLVGIVGQTIYQLSLISSSLAASRLCGAGPTLLLTLMLIRSFAERTLDAFLFSEGFTYHFFLFGVLLMAGATAPTLRRPVSDR